MGKRKPKDARPPLTPWGRFEATFFSPFEERWRGKALYQYVDPAVLDKLSAEERARAAERLAASLAETNDPRRLQGLAILDAARAATAARGIVARETDPDRRAAALTALLYLDACAPERALLPSLLSADQPEAVRVNALSGVRRLTDAHPDPEVRASSREVLFRALLDPGPAMRESAYRALLGVLRLWPVVPEPDPVLALLRSERREDWTAGEAVMRDRAKRLQVDPFSRDLLRAHLREICRDAPGTCPRCATVGSADPANDDGFAGPARAGMEPVCLPPVAEGQALHRCPDCRRPIFYQYVHEGWYTTGHEESWTVIREDALERFVTHPYHSSTRWIIRLDDRIDLTPLDS